MFEHIRARHVAVAGFYAAAVYTGNRQLLKCANIGALASLANTACDYAASRLRPTRDVHAWFALRTIPRVLTLCWYQYSAPHLARVPAGGAVLWVCQQFARASFWTDLACCTAITSFICALVVAGHYADRIAVPAFDAMTRLTVAMNGGVAPVTPAALAANSVRLTPDEALEHEDVCAVCMDSLAPRRLTCGHVFHLDCVEQWATKNHGTCPTCRAPIAGAPAAV